MLSLAARDEDGLAWRVQCSPRETMVKILFLGANAQDTARLQIGVEIRELRDELMRLRADAEIRIEAELAVHPRDLQRHLLRHAPDGLHFSGHGGGAERPAEADGDPDAALLLEDSDGGPVSLRPEALAELLKIIRRGCPLRCVVLNACFTAQQAELIARHVDCVIGMRDAIEDEAAVAFTSALYRALALGRSVETAFKLGCNQLALLKLPGGDAPALFHRPDVRPSEVRLLPGGAARPPRRAGAGANRRRRRRMRRATLGAAALLCAALAFLCGAWFRARWPPSEAQSGATAEAVP